MPNAPIHFEIPADDVKRAKKFYEKAFGWKIADPLKMDYFLVTTKEEGEPGINGGLMKRIENGQPFMNYLGVPSIDEALKKVQKAGGQVALTKMEIGHGMGWIAAFLDTEGNLIGLHQMSAAYAPPKPAAKKAGQKAVKKAVKKATKKAAAKRR